MRAKDLPLFKDPDAKKVILAVCEMHGITPKLLQALIDVERDYAGFGRNEGISEDFDAKFAEFEAETKKEV